MERERALRRALWLIRGISRRTIDRAAAVGLDEAIAGDRDALARRLELQGAAAAALQAAPGDLLGWLRAQELALRARGGRLVQWGDPDYPGLGRLPDPPEFFALRGSWCGAGSSAAVAMIGSRRADLEAVRLARRLARALAGMGRTVISGGALGIDAAAHEGALEGRGRTVAVLGSGLLRPQPGSNRRLFARILEAGGGLCSELPPDTGAMKWHFPRRNRLVAALAEAVVVVQAGEGSGCRYTVEAARALGRRIFVVPWQERGKRAAYGAALLSDRGQPATAIRDEDDLLEALGYRRRGARRIPPGLAREERQVLSALSETPAPLAAIAAASELEAGAAARILAALCGRGLARAAGPGRFAAGRAETCDS